MNHDPTLLSLGLLLISVVVIVGSVPLILRLVKMNEVYGVRIPESFRSNERWYQINRFGGLLILVWGVANGVTGAIGLMVERSHWQRLALAAAGVFFGGILLVTTAIFVYAARTKTN